MKWTRKNGETIEMKDMSESHLYNALKLTKRRLDAGEYLWTVGPQKVVVIPLMMFQGLKAEVKRRQEAAKRTEAGKTKPEQVRFERKPLSLDQLTEVGMHFVQKQFRAIHGPDCTCVEDSYKAVQKQAAQKRDIDTLFNGDSMVKKYIEQIRMQAKEEERADIVDLLLNKMFQ